MRDRSFWANCHRTAENLPHSVMPVGVVGGEAPAVGQLDDRNRFGPVCPKIEQAGILRKRRVFLPLPNLPSGSRTAHSLSPASPRSPTSAAGTTSPSIDLTGYQRISATFTTRQ